jgi:kinesin family protein 13
MTNPVSFSSGYGSQAVSSTNLSSEDSISIRSISVDETPDIERAVIFVEQLQPVSEASGDLGEKEGDTTSESNWKLSLNERMNTAVKNETQKKVAAQKPAEILEKGSNLDMTEGSLQIQNTALAEEKQASTSPAVDRNFLSLELANIHTNNLSNINDSSHSEGGDVVESSSEAHAVNEAREIAEDMPQLASGGQDCGISTAESPTSDTQSAASRRAACSSTLISPSEEMQILADTDSASVKALSSPEPTSTSITNSGDDESPCEGTSVVHTGLPPGKVWYIY